MAPGTAAPSKRSSTLQERAVEYVAKAPELSPLDASDREDELVDWFDAHGVGGGYDLAPVFVQSGIEVGWLDQVTLVVDDSMLEGAIRWLNYTLETELLMNEIEDSTTRISTLVTAAKQYSQMDRAPHQVLDIHELLDSTLVMLSRKIVDGITVVKDYDRSLPDIGVYGAEMNQVWTNVIDNALQAMDGSGTLTITTSPRRQRHAAGGDRRHRNRHPGRRGRPDLRAVLHHQAGRSGHRPRAGHLLADRGQQAPRRPVGPVGARATPGSRCGCRCTPPRICRSRPSRATRPGCRSRPPRSGSACGSGAARPLNLYPRRESHSAGTGSLADSAPLRAAPA